MARALVKEIKDTRKNYIINGDMRISQRASTFPAIGNAQYALDRYGYQKNGAMVQTIAPDGADVPSFAEANYAFSRSMSITTTTVDTITAAEFCLVEQRIEGYNWLDLFGKTFTLGFWIKSSVTGTYCVAFRNSGLDRCYVAEYTVNAANTWEYKTITIPPAPTSGTWDYASGVGLRVAWVLAAGSNFHTTANAWQTGGAVATSNQVNSVATLSTVKITGITLSEGSSAIAFKTFGENFQQELAACQRYFEKSYDLNAALGAITGNGSYQVRASGGNASTSCVFKTTKRAAASVRLYNPNTGAIDSVRNATAGTNGGGVASNVADSGYSVDLPGVADQNLYVWHWAADAELF